MGPCAVHGAKGLVGPSRLKLDVVGYSLNRHKSLPKRISTTYRRWFQIAFGQMCLTVNSSKHTNGFDFDGRAKVPEQRIALEVQDCNGADRRRRKQQTLDSGGTSLTHQCVGRFTVAPFKSSSGTCITTNATVCRYYVASHTLHFTLEDTVATTTCQTGQ